MSGSASLTPVDPLAIWTRSEALDKSGEVAGPSTLSTKTVVAQRYDGQRSVVWTSLSEMAGPNRQDFITKMIKNWPYYWEKQALLLPMHVGLLSTCFSASIVSCKINADLFLYNRNTPILDCIRRTPKSPLVFGVYTSGIMYFALYQHSVFKLFTQEDRPCSSCALTRFCAVMAFSGVLFPAATVPSLAHYVNMQRNPDLPATKGAVEFFTMLVTASQASWKTLPMLLIMQVSVAAACTYSLIWGRDRIFGTVDIEPEILREAIKNVDQTPSIRTKVYEFLSRVPVFKLFAEKVVDD